MLSVLPTPAPPETVADLDRRTNQVADSVNLFVPTRLSHGVLDQLLQESRLRADRAEFDADRPGIASVLLLAHELGLLTRFDIDKAVADGWQSILKLYRMAIPEIAGFLEQQSRRIAGSSSDHGSFEAIHLWLDRQDRFYLLLTCGLRYSEFDLSELPKPLGRAVYSCLQFVVRYLGHGMFAADVADMVPWQEEALHEFKVIRESYPNADLLELARIAQDDQESLFAEYGDHESLAENFQFLDDLSTHSAESLFGAPAEMQEIRQTVRLWRRENDPLYQHPWARFIRATLVCRKHFLRSRPETDGVVEENEWDSGEIPLDYAHIIGIGLPWECRVTEEFLNNVYQAGEMPVLRLSLDPVAIPGTAEILVLLAQARGLIRLAETISISDSQEDVDEAASH